MAGEILRDYSLNSLRIEQVSVSKFDVFSIGMTLLNLLNENCLPSQGEKWMRFRDGVRLDFEDIYFCLERRENFDTKSKIFVDDSRI